MKGLAYPHSTWSIIDESYPILYSNENWRIYNGPADSEENVRNLETPPLSFMLSIRNADPQDIPVILSFIRELAEYEREPKAVQATEADLRRD